MAKIARTNNQAQMDFQKIFNELCYTKSSWQVWTDFIFMTATAIANSCDREGNVHDEREMAYLSTINQYNEKERDVFPRLFAIMVEDMEQNPEQDFLGELFMSLELGSHWKGQFFTPYCVCKMMAEIAVNSNAMADGIEKRGWIGINDPACGAGATLIAARNAMLHHNLSPFDALFVGQDIDRTAALMCYIQLSLLGCAGYVVVADTLLHPLAGDPLLPCIDENHELWVMPMLYTDPWAGRIRWHRMDLLMQASFAESARPPVEPSPAEKDVSAMASHKEPGEPAPVIKETKTGQLTLF